MHACTHLRKSPSKRTQQAPDPLSLRTYASQTVSCQHGPSGYGQTQSHGPHSPHCGMRRTQCLAWRIQQWGLVQPCCTHTCPLQCAQRCSCVFCGMLHSHIGACTQVDSLSRYRQGSGYALSSANTCKLRHTQQFVMWEGLAIIHTYVHTYQQITAGCNHDQGWPFRQIPLRWHFSDSDQLATRR